jgi:hypothetical protein
MYLLNSAFEKDYFSEPYQYPRIESPGPSRVKKMKWPVDLLPQCARAGGTWNDLVHGDFQMIV